MNPFRRAVFAILCFILFFPKSSFASTDTLVASPLIGFNVYGGILAHHHKEMEILRKNTVKGFELSWVLVGDGRKLWHNTYNQPEFGVSYLFFDLGNHEVLGYSHSLVPFISFPILRPTKRITSNFKVGTGLAYITKTYHRTQNFKNMGISTPINVNGNFTFELAYRLSQNLTSRYGFHLSHFSNGTFKKPNAGLNYMSMSIGVTYSISSHTVVHDNFVTFTDAKNRIVLVGSGSYKEEKNPMGPKYGVGAMSFEYTRALENRMRYGVSFDLMYDKSATYLMDYEGIEWNSPWHILKTGATATFEFNFDRISAVFYMGKYITNLSGAGGPLYQRLGLRYRISNRVWTHVALKTHWFTADYVEFGVACKVF